jgi:DNA gyrase/topoisomerase IV subunit B
MGLAWKSFLHCRAVHFAQAFDFLRRTLLSVKLEDIAEAERISSTLMGEDAEARRKFIEDNAWDVRNLDT